MRLEQLLEVLSEINFTHVDGDGYENINVNLYYNDCKILSFKLLDAGCVKRCLSLELLGRIVISYERYYNTMDIKA